jgi:cytochrome P450
MTQTGHETAAAAGFNNFDYRLAGDVRNPYPEVAEIRRTNPVLSVGDTQSVAGLRATFVAFSYDAVTTVLRDNETFSSAILDDVMGEVMGHKIILAMDEPEHRRHRSLVSTAFRQSQLARWEESLVGGVVNDLIDRFADRHHAELVEEFTFPFPTKVVAGVLGLPTDDYLRFQSWAVAIITANVEMERGLRASEELKDYLAAVLEQRRVEPRKDLISELAQASLDGQELDDEEIFSFLRLLLPAGVETTFRSSGNLLYLLLTHPDQLDAVREDRSLLPQAIEEALRLEPPLLITSRIAAKDTELAGVAIPAGSMITPMMGAANRDEKQYPEPDEYNIFRDPKQHISFGTGPHMCLGMHLARMETRVAINALFDRLPNLRIDPVAFERDDPHIHGQVFRSPTSLPVLWD